MSANFAMSAMFANSASLRTLAALCFVPSISFASRSQAMTTTSDLLQKKCASCEGGVPALSAEQVRDLLPSVPEWKLSPDGKRICREWRVRDFVAGMDFFQRIAQLAEKEDHHPDLHLVGYRNVTVEIWTHAVGGLSENDFILAAKISQLPVELKK
jgi:4a-hydroxytetrahydrobiopterin dehydratase